MNRKTLMSGLVLLAVTAGAVTAQDSTSPGPQSGPKSGRFAAMDTNGDGQISPEEMRAQAEKRFGAADADGDGKVTVEEMVAHMEAREEARRAERRQRMAERMLERADDDKDGALSVAEMMPPERTQARRFDRMDANDDGMISEEEFARARHHGRRDDGEHHGRMGKRFGGHHRDSHDGGHGWMKPPFAERGADAPAEAPAND